MKTFFLRLLPILPLMLLLSCSRGPGVPEEYAGEYYSTNGFGHEAIILGKGRCYILKEGGCTGEAFKVKGKYQLSETRVIIATVATDIRFKKYRYYIYRDLYLVKWGERHMLIDRKQMPFFCNFAALGKDPNPRGEPLFFTKLADEKLSISGTPTIPSEWRQYYQQVVSSRPDEQKAIAGTTPIPPLWVEYFKWHKRKWGA